MAIHLDHFIVPSRNRAASATLLAHLLGVPWAESGKAGPFSPVYVNDGLTLDFDETAEPFPVFHYCFRVEQEEFDAILKRIKAARITCRSAPHGAADMRINTQHGAASSTGTNPMDTYGKC